MNDSHENHPGSREAAYRRGVHQALAMAADLAEQTMSLRGLRRILLRAERIAARFRERPDRPASIDLLRARLAERRDRRPIPGPWRAAERPLATRLMDFTSREENAP